MPLSMKSALASAAVLCACTFASAEPLWQTRWTLDAPPFSSLPAQGATRGLDGVAFADDGDLVLGTQGFYGYQDGFVTRVAPDGSLRWNGVVHAWDPPAAIVPLADGGAYATFATPFLWGGFASRLDASGHPLWARDVPARALVPIDATRVAISDCEALSMLDADTGVVRWSRTLSMGGNCGGDGLIVDGPTLYAFGLTSLSDVPHLVAYSLDGAFRWQADLAGTGTYFDTYPSFMGASGGHLYVRTDRETIAVDATNGAVLWRVPDGGVLLAGASREPIAFAADGLERLAADDAHSRWKASIGSHASPVGEIDGSLVAVADTTLHRIDAETGETIWSVALPAVDPPGARRNWIAIGGLAADGTFSLAGNTDFEPFVQRVDFATGALGARVPVPSIEQGMYGSSIRDGADILGYHFDGTSVMRLVDLDAATGAIRWNVATPFNVYGAGAYAYTSNVHVAFGASRVAVAVPLNEGPDSSYGFVEVAAYDRAGGALAWHVTLYDALAGESQTDVATPTVDGDGNVIVSVAMLEPCGDGTQCPKHSIYKLSAIDGSVIWRVDDSVYGSLVAKTILAIGDDVLVYGPFFGSDATLRKLSGVDGAVQWESNVFAEYGIANVHRSGANLIVFPLSFDAIQWTALDAASGATIWSSTAPCDPNANCPGSSEGVFSGGGLVVPAQPGDDALLVDLSIDGSSATTSWPVAPAASNLYTVLFGLSDYADGDIGFVLQRYGTMMGGSLWSGRFDPGAPSSTTYQRVGGQPLGEGAPGTLLLDTATFGALPTGSEYSLEDVSIHATGDLAITVAIDRDLASPGSNLGFHLTATYTGDTAISGAEIRGKLPWPSGAIDLSCTGSGVSNCVVGTSIRDLVATFDLAPGATVDVSGRLLVLDFPGGTSASIGARVVGPTALNERDTTNNFARATVAKALFANGFDD